MIKACPICGRPVLEHCYHLGKVESIMLPVEGALNLAVQHTMILNEQVSEHLEIIEKLRETKDETYSSTG